ncbi:MAG: hypothetical protein WDO73_29735 [Ignavibacteriota bacterium]
MDNGFGIASGRERANCLISLTGKVAVDTSPELRALPMRRLQDVVRGNDSDLRATIESQRLATENPDRLTGQVKPNP